jgi:signal transduction histidine kinase
MKNQRVNGMRHFAAGSGTTRIATPSILRSAVIPERWHSTSPQAVSFERMLLEHCDRIAARGRCPELTVQLDLKIEGTCPRTHEKTVLRVVDELLSNSIEHGFYSRQRGRVFVHVVSRLRVWIEVSVSDDGWGFDGAPVVDGNGFYLLRQIGEIFPRAAAAPFAAKAAVTVLIPLRGR